MPQIWLKSDILHEDLSTFYCRRYESDVKEFLFNTQNFYVVDRCIYIYIYIYKQYAQNTLFRVHLQQWLRDRATMLYIQCLSYHAFRQAGIVVQIRPRLLPPISCEINYSVIFCH
jgi:hypothetical protein